MVEGPGVRLNAEKLRRSVLNKAVSAVTGKALNADVSAQLLGQYLRTILPLGKELFLFFLATQNQDLGNQGETCLRLHFGMSGSALVNSVHRFKKSAVLEIHFDSTVLRLYETTLETRNASTTRAKIERLQSFDVCSQARNPSQTAASRGSLKAGMLPLRGPSGPGAHGRPQLWASAVA
jgi:formamidopyrimidine-DNA glycosylase